MMKASVSLVFGITATVAVLVATPVAAQSLRLDNPNGWIDRFKAEAKQEVERERLKTREAEAEQRAAEARTRYAEDRRRAVEARWRVAEAAAEEKRRVSASLRATRVGMPPILAFLVPIGRRDVKDGRLARFSSQSSAPHRDPDGIYQSGKQVGAVELPRIDESKSTVFFQRIVGAMNLNNDREFEYRKYVLRIRGELGETTSDLSGQRNRALFAVQCDIVGPASTASISR